MTIDNLFVGLRPEAPNMPPGTATTGQTLGRGDIDFSVGYASQFVQSIEAGEPITLLAGIHVGCIVCSGTRVFAGSPT